jgi:hypothetical protein
MTIENLTRENRDVLEKKYFLLWTVYKRMLMGLAIVLGTMWIWVGWEAMHDEQIVEVFIIVTMVVAVLFFFGWFTTPIYKRKTVLPLEQDLSQNQKMCKTGIVIAIERENKYNSRIVFQELGQAVTEIFILNDRFPDLYVLNREIYLEHSLHTRFILEARLLVPFTEAEVIEQNKQERIQTIAIFMVVGIIMLGIGWLFNLLFLMFIFYLVAIGFITGIIWWDKQKQGQKKRRARSIVIVVIANIVVTLLFLVGYKFASQLIWSLEAWLGWNNDKRSYLLMGIIYTIFSLLTNTVLWNFIKIDKAG